MAYPLKPSHKKSNSNILYWSMVVVSVLGILDASYLYIYKLTSNNRMCLGSGGCSTVNSSSYSEFGHTGIPVSLLGLIAFFIIICLLALEPRFNIFKKNSVLIVFGISLGGTIFSAYLTWIELFIIKAICPFCMASIVMIMTLMILSIVRLIRQLVT